MNIFTLLMMLPLGLLIAAFGVARMYDKLKARRNRIDSGDCSLQDYSEPPMPAVAPRETTIIYTPLQYAKAIQNVLPIDEKAEHAADAALAKLLAKSPKRKLHQLPGAKWTRAYAAFVLDCMASGPWEASVQWTAFDLGYGPGVELTAQEALDATYEELAPNGSGCEDTWREITAEAAQRLREGWTP